MSFALLKEEINQTHNTIYDIAKWKLILVSSISAVALGLTKDPTGDFHLLLLLLPLVCAYSDLLYYQNLLRIFVLATYLRKRQSWDTLVEYEQFVCSTRSKRVFNLELSSQLLSSLAFSSAAIIAIYLEIQHPTFAPEVSLWSGRIISGTWAAGVVLILWVYVLFRQRNWVLDKENEKEATTPWWWRNISFWIAALTFISIAAYYLRGTWAAGVVLILWLYVLFRQRNWVLDKKKVEQAIIPWWWNISFWIAALTFISIAAYQLPVLMSKLPKSTPAKIVPAPTSPSNKIR